MSVKFLKTNDTWYGMTYHEDVAAVKDSFKKCWRTACITADEIIIRTFSITRLEENADRKQLLRELLKG